VGAKFSAPVPTGRGAHPASNIMGIGSFPGVKRPGRGVDHPPLSSAEVKESVDYTPTAPMCLRCRRMTFIFTFINKNVRLISQRGFYI
jgi:hypothetical protein